MVRRLFAILPSAGTGARMGARLPKQYLSLLGKPLAEHTLTRLLEVPGIERIQVALHADDAHFHTLPLASHPRVNTCVGGASRAESVLCALNVLLQTGAGVDDWVLVHDMARPCVRVGDIEKLLSVTDKNGALLALPVVDTVKQAKDDGTVVSTLDRRHIWRALTPQFFPLGTLRAALLATAHDPQVTDEASAMERQGYHPLLVEGQADNIKVTQPADMALATFYLLQQTGEQP